MSSSSVMDSVVLREEGLGSLWNNLGWIINANFPPFLFAYLEATDQISLMFVLEAMLTILKGLHIFSVPAMPLRSYLFLVSLICLGVTVRSFVLKSYRLTSEIAYAVRTLVARSSDPSSVSLTYR